MKILVIDVGGTNVKFLVTGQTEARRFPSGPKLTPRRMVAGIKQFAADWEYEAITIGYPGVVKKGRVVAEPRNLGRGWIGFNFRAAFRRPVKVINDAAMQALGNYRGGLLLFLGLGTGLGSALIADDVLVPLELGHLSYKHGTFEDYVGASGMKRIGMTKWRKHIGIVARRFIAALNPDDVVLGGGNAKHLQKPPKGCRMSDNTHAFLGGFRLWEKTAQS